MKISDLITQLRFLQTNYGDLECVLGLGEDMQVVRHPKVRTVEDSEAGLIPGIGAGDRISVLFGGGEASHRSH